MKTISVDLSACSYQVHIGAGLLSHAGRLLRDAGLASGRAVVITDSVVGRRHGAVLRHGLAKDGIAVDTLTVPEGEPSKCLETAMRLYDDLTNLFAERQTPILALGGGVIGDLAGFVAATYLRGVPLVQFPTTLLAQIDSSIGGKVAVDHGRLKNKIGAFYQPRLVISDTSTLKTLPKDELANGLAEVIKTAVILDAGFFAFLEDHIDDILNLADKPVEDMVYTAARLKAGIVEQDEKEEGLRAILNFGHTVGHAIESVSGFALKHGQAVALGMLAAAHIAVQLGDLTRSEAARLKALIQKAGLPVTMPEIDNVRLFEAMKHDKKVTGGNVRFVLPKSLGAAYVSDKVNPAMVERALSQSYE